jgi:hypothetical protein
MKTAVEWLADELCYITDNDRYIIDNTDDVADVVNQAKEMEKEQIINAFHRNSQKWFCEEEAEQYYNETFKQQEQCKRKKS